MVTSEAGIFPDKVSLHCDSLWSLRIRLHNSRSLEGDSDFLLPTPQGTAGSEFIVVLTTLHPPT